MVYIVKPVFIKVFMAKSSVKTLNKRILCRLFRPDKFQQYTMLFGSLHQCQWDHFWPVKRDTYKQTRSPARPIATLFLSVGGKFILTGLC